MNLAWVGWGYGQTTHVLILNMEEIKHKESAFVSKWPRRKLSLFRMMLLSKKSNSSTDNCYMTLLDIIKFVDHTRSNSITNCHLVLSTKWMM